MLHELVLRASDWVDQHVCRKPLSTYALAKLNDRMSLQSALIGFLMSKFFPKPITAQENIVLQTTAVATGTVRWLSNIAIIILSVFTDAAGCRLRRYPTSSRPT